MRVADTLRQTANLDVEDLSAPFVDVCIFAGYEGVGFKCTQQGCCRVVEPWKIDILNFLNENYMLDLSLSEIARYTGRSLATFKRDFAKVSDLTPQKWIIRRRLEAAHELIASGSRKISEICFDVGFKNLSHFSKLYKETYGMAPSR